MPQDDIAGQWKSFDLEKRDRLLKKMTPEQKKKLRGMLEAKPAPPTTPADLKRKVSAENLTSGYDPEAAEFDERHPVLGKPVRALSAVGGAVLGLPGQIYHSFADPLTPEETKEFEGHTRIPGEVAVERLTGARGIVEAGKDYASGKVTLRGAASVLPEALGAGIGTYVGSELAGRGLSKVGQLRKYASEQLQPTARKVTGVEPAVRESVTKAAEKHAGAVEDVEAQKAQQAERGVQAKTVDEQSVKVGKQIEQVQATVKKEGDAKFDIVREKLGVTKSQKGPNGEIIPGHPGPSTDPTPLVNTVKHAQEITLQKVPENVKEFRAILYHEELPESVASAAERHGFDLEGPEPLTWQKLQALKTRLDTKLRKPGAMNPDLKRALYDTREAVVGEMGKMADANGAGPEWADAKNLWRQYKEDFEEPTGPSGSGSPVAQALNAVDPQNIRAPFLRTQSTLGNRGVDILRKYPQHGGTEAAAAVEGLVQEHGKLKYMPDKNPNPPAPKSPTVDVGKVARETIAQRAKNWGSFNARDVGIIMSSAIAEPLAKLLGLGGGGGSVLPVAVGAYEGGKFAMSRALNSPKVIEWLSKTPPQEAAVLAKIPGADKVRIMDGLTQVALDSGKPVNLSPAARSLLGPANVAKITAISAGASRVNNRRDALERLGQPTQ